MCCHKPTDSGSSSPCSALSRSSPTLCLLVDITIPLPDFPDTLLLHRQLRPPSHSLSTFNPPASSPLPSTRDTASARAWGSTQKMEQIQGKILEATERLRVPSKQAAAHYLRHRSQYSRLLMLSFSLYVVRNVR